MTDIMERAAKAVEGVMATGAYTASDLAGAVLQEGSPQNYGKGGRLAEALARAQGEIKNPGKSATNPHFKSKYSTLAEGIDAVRAALSKHGIAHNQTTRVDGGILFLTTILTHAVSGESIESEWPVGAYEKLSPQQMGSALTYARRYSLFPMVGISGADDDDDGNAASTGRGNGSRYDQGVPLPTHVETSAETYPGNVARSAERYIQETEAWISNASDPTSIRERWTNERLIRRELLVEEEASQLLKLVTDRLTQLGNDGNAASAGSVASAEYLRAAEAWVTNSSDPDEIRERWNRESVTRRSLLGHEQSQGLRKVVKERLISLGVEPKQ